MEDDPVRLRHVRYVSIVNIVFGAGLGVIGVIDRPTAPIELNSSLLGYYGLAVLHLVVVAFSALWIIARNDVISDMILQRKRVLPQYYAILFLGIFVFSAAIVVISVLFYDVSQLRTAGFQIAAVLTAWSILLIVSAYWARRSDGKRLHG